MKLHTFLGCLFAVSLSVTGSANASQMITTGEQVSLQIPLKAPDGSAVVAIPVIMKRVNNETIEVTPIYADSQVDEGDDGGKLTPGPTLSIRVSNPLVASISF